MEKQKLNFIVSKIKIFNNLQPDVAVDVTYHLLDNLHISLYCQNKNINELKENILLISCHGGPYGLPLVLGTSAKKGTPQS